MDSSLLKARRDYSIKLLKRIISIPSSNPHVSDKDEKEIAGFLKDELKNAGLQVSLEQVTSEYPHAALASHRTYTRPNVIARTGKKGGIKLILNGHIDTVSGKTMRKAFQPRLVGDRLYGRGSSDMKGGVAAIVAATEAVIDSCQELEGELVLALVVDEETEGQGTRDFLARESGDFAIIGEPTENTLGIAQAGFIDFNISFRGESRHGQTALPDVWASAFLQAASVCNRILEDRKLVRKERRMGVEMETTFNASPVRPVVHPSHAWMTVEEFTVNCLLGLIPGRTIAESERSAKITLNRIKQHVTEANGQGQRSKVSQAHWNIGLVQETNAYVRRFERVMQEILGHRRRSYVLSFCDATHFYRANIPTILFGPGRMELGHSTNEYTSIRQVKDATSVLAHAIERILA